MQDTNKNAIWIFVVIIVVLGLIWATSSKPKTTPSTTDVATTTANEVTTDNTANSGGASTGSGTVVSNSTVKSPILPAAGIGPKN